MTTPTAVQVRAQVIEALEIGREARTILAKQWWGEPAAWTKDANLVKIESALALLREQPEQLEELLSRITPDNVPPSLWPDEQTASDALLRQARDALVKSSLTMKIASGKFLKDLDSTRNRLDDEIRAVGITIACIDAAIAAEKGKP